MIDDKYLFLHSPWLQLESQLFLKRGEQRWTRRIGKPRVRSVCGCIRRCEAKLNIVNTVQPGLVLNRLLNFASEEIDQGLHSDLSPCRDKLRSLPANVYRTCRPIICRSFQV